MTYFRITTPLLALSLLASACGDDAADDPGREFGGPAFAPLVAKGSPSALRPGSTTWAGSTDPTTPSGAVATLFRNQYDKALSGQTLGAINAMLEDIDDQVLVVNASKHKCLLRAPALHRVELTSISPSLDLTLNAQCNRALESPTGSLVYGSNGSTYSAWLDLPPSGGGERAVYANASSVGSAAENLEVMILEHAASDASTAYRVRVRNGTGLFELSYASTGYLSGLECGTRLISNGSVVYVGGKLLASATADCATAPNLEKCYDANTFVEQTGTGSCDAVKAKLSLEPMFRDNLTGNAAALSAVLSASNAASETKAE